MSKKLVAYFSASGVVADHVEIIAGKLLNGKQTVASVKAWTDSLGL